MPDDPKKILDLIQKLLAHAESAEAIGNEEEAKTFAAKVQELLTKYKLSIADVKGTAHVGEEIDTTYITWRSIGLPERAIPVWWTELLARIVADAYYTAFIAARGVGSKLTSPTYGHIGYFVGAETDRKLAVWMYAYLARFLETEATRQYDEAWKAARRERRDVRELRGYRKGWIEGLLVRLAERFQEEFKKEKPATADAPSGSQAIVLRTNALALVDQWIKKNQPGAQAAKKHHSLPDGSVEGFEAGLEAGDAIDLKKKALEQRAGGPQRLAERATTRPVDGAQAVCRHCGERIQYFIEDHSWHHSIFSRRICPKGEPK